MCGGRRRAAVATRDRGERRHWAAPVPPSPPPALRRSIFFSSLSSQSSRSLASFLFSVSLFFIFVHPPSPPPTSGLSRRASLLPPPPAGVQAGALMPRVDTSAAADEARRSAVRRQLDFMRNSPHFAEASALLASLSPFTAYKRSAAAPSPWGRQHRAFMPGDPRALAACGRPLPRCLASPGRSHCRPAPS